eukprot:TRINITY_DN20779_c0_g1_i1.p1 TRINITY_DN20779_c0_g1~~TRINITY_DN20779_c0_g1_i1.p1  ORF type:complete len:478 (+),score=120.91 TRINITY_DN20779_c0_g1_i1:30-1463(+)
MHGGPHGARSKMPSAQALVSGCAACLILLVWASGWPTSAQAPTDAPAPLREYGPGGLRYHELPPLDSAAAQRKPTSSFTDGTMVRGAAWFDAAEACLTTCCYRRVAVSLAQDDAKFVSNVASQDLSEVRVHPWEKGKRPGYYYPHVDFFAPELTQALLPCLQNGTLIHADSAEGAQKFFEDLQPHVTSPYVLTTTATDRTQPQKHGKPHLRDASLIKWFGMNPQPNAEEAATGKFAGFPLGLNTMMTQEAHITPYLEMRKRLGQANPFMDKTRWTESALLFDEAEEETTDVVFVKFGMGNKYIQHRWVPFNHTCAGRKRTPRSGDTVSCTTDAAKFTMQETYAASSRYLFGVSPKGVGLDCYRTYELLAMGVIPIVKDSDAPMEGYVLRDLPIVRVASWEYSQRELLQILRDYVRSNAFAALDTEKGWARLFLRHWRRELLAAAGRPVVRDPAGDEYFLAWEYVEQSSVAVVEGRVP